MGNTGGKFRKALVGGDEVLAWQIYEGHPQFRESLDPNASYGEAYQHNTPLHFASRHAMTQLLRAFLFNKEGNPNKRNLHNETALHLLCMGPHILLPEAVLLPRLAHPREDEQKRLECLRLILAWTGARLDRGEYERANVNAIDNKKNTCLHYAAASGMVTCVELLLRNNVDLFAENESKETACDCAEQWQHRDLALRLESHMVFSQDPEAESVGVQCDALDHREPYEGLRPQDLRRLKDMLIVETADMLQAPLFTAEALLRAHDWDKEKLLESWMSNAEDCCQRSGVQMPTPPPTGYNTWDTLPSAHMPRTTKSSVTSPDEISMDEDMALCGICMCAISVFEEPVDMACGHEFCRACWEGFLNVKIQEGDAHNIFCPAYECFQLVPVEVIESIVSREMDRRYLQFDIKAFVENNPSIRWCPRAGCERAVRLSQQDPGNSCSELLHQPLLQAPAVDCGKGHLFCWSCLGEAHEPCSCQTWKQWLQKVSEMNPEKLAGVNAAYEDAANLLWLRTNSKSCPICKSPIQKNEGCNHMQCAKCKYDFCWICLEEWKKHSSSTGGYYRCTRYEVIQQVEEQSKELTAEAERKHKNYQELNRFMHYYTRYKNHEHSYQLERRLLKTAKAKMEQLSRALGGREQSPPDTMFIEKAVQELLKTHHILKCSYPYGFFLEPKSTKKEIFELMQTDLEMVTEDLAQKVNRPYLRTPHHKIMRATCLVRQKRQEFLASVARGVAPNDSPVVPRSSLKMPRYCMSLQGYTELQRRSRQRQHGDLSSVHISTATSNDASVGNLGTLEPLSSLEEDDAHMLLAIQLSLQDPGLGAVAVEPHEASLRAMVSSSPPWLDPAARNMEAPWAAGSRSFFRPLKSSSLVNSEDTPGEPTGGTMCSGEADHTDLNSAATASFIHGAVTQSHDADPKLVTPIPFTSSTSSSVTSPVLQGSAVQVPQVPWIPPEVLLQQQVEERAPSREQEAVRLAQLELESVGTQAMQSVVPEGRRTLPISEAADTDTHKYAPGSTFHSSSTSSDWEEKVHLV
ncbi:ankyrin repeat and IBR domain-containing protein 1-like isoform X2 [Arapaima gigas]